ncbi:uncharacterized protein [Argopecten irradians]|uniref:uncharacterized protein n=1 Tax=Argopecten irradians TaxID=31199 RepID=UPI0037194534
MVIERNTVRTGQEHDEKTPTDNMVYSAVKTGDQSDGNEEEDNELSSLSIDDIINHIEQLKIKDEKKDVLTARGKIKTPQNDERLYPYIKHHQIPDNVQVNLPEYRFQQPYPYRHSAIIPPAFQQLQNYIGGKQNYVAAVDERCRFWMKPKEEIEYYQQKNRHHLLPRKNPQNGRWEEDGRVRKQKASGNTKPGRKTSLSSIRKAKQGMDLNVADGAIFPYTDDFPADEDIIDGIPFDLDVDGEMHFSEKGWEDGIPKLALLPCDLMEFFGNCPDSHIVSKTDNYSPLSPLETIPNYNPSPVRIDEVYNQDSNEKLSEHSQDECEIVDSPQSGHSPGSHFSGDQSPHSTTQLTDYEVCSPAELSPGELKNLEQITQHLNDTFTVLDDTLYFDWISCDQDGDSLLHSCLIAEHASSSFILVLIETLASEGILSSIINLQNKMLRTALFLAVMEGKVDIAKSLLDNNADPNIQGKVPGLHDDYELRSPLHLVAEEGDKSLPMLEILLDCDKTQVDLRSESDRKTALHLAFLSHCVDKPERSKVDCSKTIDLLIRYNADVELAEDCSSKTPIIMAIDTRDYSLVKSFLNCVEEEKDKDMIRCILETCTRAGDTPLHIAAGANILKEDKVKLIRLLVNRGANTHTENNIKQLPEDIASRDLWKAAFRC